MMVWKIEHKRTYHKITTGKTVYIITRKRWYDIGIGLARSLYSFMAVLCASALGLISSGISRGIYPTEFTSLSYALFTVVVLTILAGLSFSIVIVSTQCTYKRHLEREKERRERKKAKHNA